MKFRYLLLLGLCSAGCESSQQNQQARERKQSLNTKQVEPDEGSTGTTQGSQETPTSSFVTTTTSKGLIDEEFRVSGGPTTYQAMPVVYGQGAASAHKGFYIRDTDSGPSGPGILAIHGIMGPTEAFKRNLMRFAAKGYRVLAIDLYEGKLPGQDNSAEAEQLHQSIQARGKNDVLSNITSGVDYLRSELGATSLGVVGWDEGGYWAIETMSSFPGSFAALVNYYGSPFELSKDATSIPIPTLHIFPNEDDRQTEELLQLERSINEQSPHKAEFRIYRDVSSDFLEPSKGNQDKENVKIAYDHTFLYLDAIFKQD